MKITKKTKISEVLKENPEAFKILLELGIGCIGCPMMQLETIEQGLTTHGFSETEISEIIEKMNNLKK